MKKRVLIYIDILLLLLLYY